MPKKKLITVRNKAGKQQKITPEHFERLQHVQKNSSPDQVFFEVKEKKDE